MTCRDIIHSMVAQAPHVGCLLALPVHRGHRRQHSRRRPCLAPPFAALSPPPEKPDVAEPAPAAPSAGRRWWANNPVGEFIDDRLRADPRYLQKVGIEVGIDSACTLTAELAARGAAAFGACVCVRSVAHSCVCSKRTRRP